MPGFSQFGIDMPQQDPFSIFGIGGGQGGNAFSGMGLSPAAGGGGFWSGLHGPQLSDWGGGAGGMMQLMAIPGLMNELLSYRDPNQGWLGGGLQGAMQGAGVGSMFGAPGALIGAGTGYMGGKK